MFDYDRIAEWGPALSEALSAPNLVSEVIRAWAWWVARPSFSTASEGIDCGIYFHASVPPEWIVSVEFLEVA